MNVPRAGFAAAQFMVCGVLGPKSNAHGPSAFLHVPYAQKLTAAATRPAAYRRGMDRGVRPTNA
ncbi:peptidase M20 [Burkholderia ambifaria MEX-5]|uniref:Peptidase M20 n=1 Tax=Burkholderia ambifaria MEX-5 TaxID=396597 RepID=B1T343_9BURK|nr:peptidase M20 [Burkholderia ambifaria MEX-5]